MGRILSLLSLTTILGLSLVHGDQQSAFDPTVLSEAGRQAYQILHKAVAFRLGPVGYAGTTSQEETSLHVLLKESEAAGALSSLVDGASPEGKLYGLLGLRLKDATAYRQALERLKSNGGPPERKSVYGERKASDIPVQTLSEWGVVPPGEVITQEGCLISREKMSKLIAAIEAGSYDKLLKRRKDRISPYARHN